MIIASREDKDPYTLDLHIEDCPEDVFDDDGNLLAIRDQVGQYWPNEELGDRGCSACLAEMELWARIIEDTGDVEYGHLAIEALEMDNFIEVFRPKPSRVASVAWEYVKTVRAEKNRREAQRIYVQNQQNQEAKSKPK